nr:hypothetical protein GCM10017745_12740 [Saccharothrix mutabilis subsp. capreolus]
MVEIIIMPGMIIAAGFLLLYVNIRTIIPTDDTIMTAGIAFIMMLPGMIRGTSGGGSRWTSPPGGRGAARRAVRLNCNVLT